MKRRDFLLNSAAAAGILVPSVGQTQSRPCPPQTVNVSGGVSATTACAVSAESDWLARISGTGVVWYHDFRSDAEVDQFAWSSAGTKPAGYQWWSGNDPTRIGTEAQYIRRITTDGVAGGGCLECYRPAGTNEIGTYWWRPFSPLRSPGNGRGSDDPAGGGAVLQTWTPTIGGSQTNDWSSPNSSPRGVYGHSSYGSTATGYDGSEYYLQLRVKMDPRRWSGGNEAFTVGKLIILTHTRSVDVAQKLVIYSYGAGGNQGAGKNYLKIYGGWGDSTPLDQELEPYDGIQPGSDSAADWYWSGGWDTIMLHLRPGRLGVDETLLEIFAARSGETSYTRIWNQTYPIYDFDWDNGQNAIVLSTYNNSDLDPSRNFPQDFYHRYDQIIFSKSFIPCPEV